MVNQLFNESNRVWLSSPHMSGREMKYIDEAFKTNWIAPLGPNVTCFENELSSYLRSGHVAALSSGTAAIHLALIILGIKEGDEVITSTFTFSATVNPIVYLKATPVFVDSEKTTGNMDPELLRNAIEDRIRIGKKPKAILVVHLYGMPAQIDVIADIARHYEIPLIEDAAEALGSKFNGKAAGTFGDMGILSFNGNKIITTSGGGALVSDNEEYISRARFLSTQARDKAPYYQHSSIGYNYRMSNVLAGIGRGQLEVIDDRVEARRNNFNFYLEILGKFSGVSFIKEPSNAYSNRWLTTIVIDPEKCNVTNDDIRISLEKENIETRPLWKPMHLQPVFMEYPAYVNGISEQLFNNGLCLPSGSNLEQRDRNRIHDHLDRMFSRSKTI